MAALLLLTLVVAPFAGLAHRAWWLALAVPAALVGARAARRASWPLAHAGLLAALALAAAGSGMLGPWPVPLVVAFAAYFAVVRAVPGLRASLRWPVWRARPPDRATVVLFAATVAVSAVALVLYAWLAQPDVTEMAGDLGDLPAWSLPLGGVAFAVVNPAVEEALYRGALYHALEAETGSDAQAVIGQGIAFGALHVAGFPGGAGGVLLAGAWGIVLGVLRARTGGLRWSWWAHVAANVVIYAAVVALAADQGIL